MRNRTTSLAFLTALGAAAPGLGRAETSAVTVRADAALRGVPPRFLGASFTSFGKSGSSPQDFAPCCLGPLAALPRPLGLWRTPGGALAAEFHFLTGTYGPDPDGAPNGVTFDGFARAAEARRSGLLHVLNLNASDQELVNLIEYANLTAPYPVDTSWTPTRFRQHEQAGPGYFAWLRQLRWARRAPLGLRYVALGNQIWNSQERDSRCNHDAACYGREGARLAQRLKAKDPALQIGASILTLDQARNPGYRNAAVYAGWQAAGVAPDFVSDHASLRCGYGGRDAQQAEAQVRFGDALGEAARRNREELTRAFPDCGRYIGLFLDEVSFQACAGGPEPFESFTPWAVAGVAHLYAAALHAGYSHVSYYAWNGDPLAPEGAGHGLVSGEGAGTVDAAYWGLWFATRLLGGAVSELELLGLPRDLRGVAVHAPGLVRLLLINASSTTARTLSITVEGRSPRGATTFSYLGDREHGGLGNVFARRSQVPQAPPPGRPQDLSAVAVPPLSTVLVEIDVGSAQAPEARAAATGCADEEVKNPEPERPAPDPREPGGGGCSAGGPPRQPAPLLLLALAPLALARRAGTRAVTRTRAAPGRSVPRGPRRDTLVL